MKQNLIMIHLESLPQILFWQYQAQLPTLWKLREESMYFTRCFTTGAATIFAYNSVFRGTTEAFDPLESYQYDHCHSIEADSDSFVRVLRDDYGYQTAFLFYNFKVPNGSIPQQSARYGFSEYLADTPYKEKDDILSGWLDRLNPDAPFFSYFHYEIDLLHHKLPRELLRDRLKDGVGSVTSLMLELLEKTVARSLALFDRRGVLENSMVVVFSDHGWDYQKRFNAEKYSQGSYATSQVAWVPLFIRNSRLGRGVSEKLASLDDFPATITSLLVPGADFSPKAVFPGLDLTRETREFAFTQNKFALQDPSQQGTETPKTYAVTDGIYRLIAEEVDPEKRTGGMQMFLEQLDPGNQADLLELFGFDAAGHIVGLDHGILKKGTVISFPPLVNIPGLLAIATRYEVLRSRLRDYVRGKEKEALGKLGAKPFVMREESFTCAACGWGREGMESWEEIEGRVRRIAERQVPVLLFGSRAFITSYVMAVLDYYGVKLVGILDNMKSEQYGTIDGLTIYPPAEGAAAYPGALVVSCICSAKFNAEAKAECDRLGLEYHSYIADIIVADIW